MEGEPRKAISASDDREIADFYEGYRCVVTGGNGTRHHHRGEPSPSGFVDIIPVDWELHSGLVPSSRSGIAAPESKLPAKLDLPGLRHLARQCYREDCIPRAFGCARLAYSLGRYFVSHDPERELECVADALAYLRRYRGPHLTLRNLLMRDVITRDLLEIVRTIQSLPARPLGLLIIELASWLNEGNEPALAKPHLEDALALVESGTVLHLDQPEERRRYASFLRQLAYNECLLYATLKNVDQLIKAALEIDRSAQNEDGSAQIWMLALLRDGNHEEAFSVIHEHFEAMKKRTAGFYNPELSATIPGTFVAMPSYMAIAAGTMNSRRAMNLSEESLSLIQTAESRTAGVKPASLYHVSEMFAAIESVKAKHAELGSMLERRIMPPLSREDADLVESAIRQLREIRRVIVPDRKIRIAFGERGSVEEPTPSAAQ